MINGKSLNLEELEQITGGNDGFVQATWVWGTVTGTKNYLAIRTAPAYDETNEIGKIYNGTKIQIRTDLKNGVYVWAYASSINKEGWVNGNYVK